MKKLIELLNEFDSGWDYDDYYGPYQYGQDRDAYQYGKYYLVSRDYKFIKWLVENNKIDIERLHKIVDYRLEIKENYFNAHDYNSDCLLMLLSISDTPIEDLISYLR